MEPTRELLTNDFHKTEYKTNKTHAEIERLRFLPKDQMTGTEGRFVYRIAKKLCTGDVDCCCGMSNFCERRAW